MTDRGHDSIVGLIKSKTFIKYSYVFKFEKLEIWRDAIDITDQVDKLTKAFPKDEIFCFDFSN
jgi:hypothetical protein